ncbi:MAG TPA: T9SS type A sorting domain-containing protein, partial [Chitinophagaceae bacterium]|nr:T9SS type A sorting domain-containing protein [Chitinophagaceae bacterium]
MINFPNVIDNHIISNEVEPFYVPGSAKIKNDVTSIIPDYVTAHNTSDHYPVFSQYNLSGVVTGVTNVSANEMGVVVYPNPFKENIYIKATKTLTNVNMQLINMQGQVIHKKDYNLIPAGSFTNLSYPALQSGIYFLQMETRQYKTVVKL